MYEQYKPLRNIVGKLDTHTALINIWQLIQNIKGEFILPFDFHHLNGASIKDYVYEWELAILAREVILNSGSKNSRSLLRFQDFQTIINLVKKTSEEQSRRFVNDKNILHEMHRISQQQFPFQTGKLKLYRFLTIFRNPELEKIFFEVTGLTISKFFFMALSVSGSFLRSPYYSLNQNFSEFGISNQERDIFFGRVVTSLTDIKDKTKAVQEYNENWSYTFNPLLATPLIIDSKQPNLVSCPIPAYLNSRIGEGLIFDIFKRKSGSEEVYGNAFESYVENVTRTLISNPLISIGKEAPYRTGKQLKHGVDLYVYDNEYALIVESKAKRLNLNSRYQGKKSSLDADLKILAKFVVQNYKNLVDIINKKTNWNCGSRTLYPIIVSLMECYIWTEEMQVQLDRYVNEKLSDLKIDPEITKRFPYILMTIEDYELSIQVISRIGFHQYFTDKADPKYARWTTDTFVREKYAEFIATFNSRYLYGEVQKLMQEFNIDNQPLTP